MKEYNIYVGLSDPVTHEQIFDTDEYTNILKQVCKNYMAPFSFEVIQGGYIYDDGEFADETALHIMLFDQTEDTVHNIADDLCIFFNQESVLITSSEVEVHTVTGDSEMRKLVHSHM